MASISSSFSSLASTHDHERLDLQSIRALVVSVNHHIHEFLANNETRKSLKLRCSLKLRIQKQEFFEFSEHSVISNLYWGIESVEAAIRAKWPEEKTSRLKNSEQMLQVPALLDEQGTTGGISNRYIVCCSYFYLSIVRKLQRDEWQVALHFLQALMVSPRLIQTEFAPGLCENLFLTHSISERQNVGGRSFRSVSLMNSDEGKPGEAIRETAKRYKSWLMYYQVVQYGETPQRPGGYNDILSPVDQSPYNSMYGKSSSTKSSSSIAHGNTSLQTYRNFQKVHPLDPQESIIDSTGDKAKASRDNAEIQDYRKALNNSDQVSRQDIKRSSNIKCLQDMLMESQSDTPTSDDSFNDNDSADGDSEAYADETQSSMEAARIKADQGWMEISDQRFQNSCCISTSFPPLHEETNEANIKKLFSGRFSRSFNDLNLSILELGDEKSHTLWTCHAQEETTWRRLEPDDFQILDCLAATSLQNYMFAQMEHNQGNDARKKHNSSRRQNLHEVCLHPEKDSHGELLRALDKAISKLWFSEGQGKYDEDSTVEVTTIYEMLTNKTGVKYTLLKDAILDQLLSSISTSKKEGVVRASVSILLTIIAGNKSVIDDIKKKGLQLGHLANALKRNAFEAATLIYLINPSPTEIKTLELLPTLMNVVCTSNNYVGGPASLPTPPAASLMIIEALITAFDYATNSMHLAEISSPQVLSGLLDVARNNNLEELIPLATILVKCMQFDGQCRNYISQFTPMAPFIYLLRSNERRVKLIALEFFHEILRMPRSSAISVLQQMKKEGSINIMHILLPCLQQSQAEHQLLAANLLLQLDQLEDSSGRSMFREEAMEVLLESMVCEENSATQILSAFILSNLGGTYSWTGEPYTVAWLVKKAGLTSLYHRNMIRNFDWLDQSLQDTGTDTWCSKIGRSIIKGGIPLFHALEKGLKSKVRRVSRDCLTAIAWLGYEIATSPNELRYSACEILLSGIEQFLHPGLDLEERLLACLCIYNYASGKGMQKLIHFSEGVRESLGRLSNITWMAEELLKIADYFLPYKSRISCVHTQILEMGRKCSGAVTALIYYRGQLCSGYSDGSIKVWDIKGQSATLVLDIKEHRKAVTCFSHFEPGDSLLSGSADKTIRVWQMVKRKMECTEVISTKEPVQNLDTHGQLIFTVTHGHGVKVFDASRKAKDICKSKHVKCIRVVQGRLYIGCMDSSIQEVAITRTREQEIRAPAKSWRMQNRPINSIVVYKDWLYSASDIVEGSNFKEWKRHSKPQMSMVPDKGASALAMGIVEDFIYLNGSSSTSILQIWLRGTQQKAGRLSAGSRITSLLTANDIVLCGTEMGLIKGWIPL